MLTTATTGPTRALLDAVINAWADATKSKKPFHQLLQSQLEKQMLERLKKLVTKEFEVLSAAAAK